MGKRLGGTSIAGLTGLWVALALAGCANVAQQGAAGTAAVNPSAGQPGTVDAAGRAMPQAAPLAAGAAVAAAGDARAARAKRPPTLVYRVRRGDTLARIAQHHRCSVRQLEAWNSLKGSVRLKPGQVLHVAAPETVRAVNAEQAAARDRAAQATAATAAAASATDASPSAPAAVAQATASPAPSADTQLSGADARDVAQQLRRHASGVSLAWPAGGRVVERFQPGETRGIEIGGKAGDPVLAAADGRVMYAGTGLNGYGSLIIVQHNKDFLTAYSHNRKLLVKIGDLVRQGQQIAEMGDENNTRVSVGFELRRDGKPIDPMPYLPSAHG